MANYKKRYKSKEKKIRASFMDATVFALLLTLCLAIATPATAGMLEDATAAYKRGDYATEIRLLRQLAEQGDALAQLKLGYNYAKGQE